MHSLLMCKLVFPLGRTNQYDGVELVLFQLEAANFVLINFLLYSLA